ncbi:hypothetical protein [Kiloniella sp.]|uniref:hypothetical protein n=1 Tax=Kiloniella sp. TaxID=1938587 RepID=UPI003B01E1B1
MTTTNQQFGEEFKIGKVIERSYEIFSQNIYGFTFLVILFQIPAVVWSFSSGDYAINFEDEDAVAAVNWLDHYGIMFLSIILSFISDVAIIYGVFLHITGRAVTISECLTASIFVFVPVLVAGLLSIFLSYSGYLIYFMPEIYALLYHSNLTILLLMPGVYFGLYFFVLFPVIVVEQPGIIASFKRSSELTKGHHWSLLAVSLMIIAGAYGLGLLEKLIIVHTIAIGFDLAGVAMTTFIGSLYVAFLSVFFAITYYNLRAQKEGAPTDQIVSVFD